MEKRTTLKTALGQVLWKADASMVWDFFARDLLGEHLLKIKVRWAFRLQSGSDLVEDQKTKEHWGGESQTQYRSKKVSARLMESPQAKASLWRSPTSCSCMLSHRLGIAHGKCGLRADTEMDPEGVLRNWGLRSIMFPKEEYMSCAFSWPPPKFTDRGRCQTYSKVCREYVSG